VTDYIAAVRERLGEQATPDVLAVAEALERQAGRDGALPGTLGTPPIPQERATAALSLLRRSGLYQAQPDRRIVLPEPIGWQWSADPRRGLQSAKHWTIALASCRKFTSWKAKTLGAVIREHADMRDGTAYVGIQKLAKLTGWFKRDVETSRDALREAGWLLDTGHRKGRAIVFRLSIPPCDCGCNDRDITGHASRAA
jgi:biotin operon repressor